MSDALESTSGGFLGPSMVGYFKQLTGSDSSAFLCLAGIASAGILVCLTVRQATVFKPWRPTSPTEI